MELVYLYLEKYGNLKNKEFNFNPKYRFNYDSVKKELSYHTQNEGFTINIFNNIEDDDIDTGYITNVTAIVGANGSGKTNSLRFILDCFNDYDNILKTIVIFLQEDKFIVYSNISDIHRKDEYSIVIEFTSESNINKMNYLSNFQLIHFSNVFDSEYFLKYSSGNSKINDISTTNMIKSYKKLSEDMKIQSPNSDPNRIFFDKEFLSQINFVFSYKNNNVIPFNLPKYIKVSASDNREYMLQEVCALLGNAGQYDIKNNFERIYNILKGNYLREDEYEHTDNRISLGILASVFNQIIPRVSGTNNNKKIYEYIKSITDEFIENNEALKNNSIDYVDNFIKILKKEKKVSLQFDAFSSVIDFIKNKEHKIYPEFYNLMYLDLRNIDKSYLSKIEDFYSAYRKAAFEYDFLTFSWGLSTGEYNLLSLFSRFYSLAEKDCFNQSRLKMKKDCITSVKYLENVLILIDEADLSFNPKWQQIYIKLLLKFLKSIYTNCNIQLIITTHSPIILSDIPLCNTIYLSDDSANDNHIETFGANIYSIYNNSFFLDKNNIGMLGELSKYHINKANNILKGYYNLPKSVLIKDGVDFNRELKERIEKDLDYCKKIINLVGEEIIRQSLLKKYNYIRKNLYPEENDNKKLQNIIDQYDSLNKYEKEELISYIIKKEDKDRG
ncbi:TPA: AAA family ATPase [Clostridioides difficile]|nr:AAA family ATPase [Clostridioides difficile]